MKKIIVLSAGRSDLDRIRPILEKLNKKNIQIKIVVSKAHMSKVFGFTYKNLTNKGFKILKEKNNINFKDNPSFITGILSREISYISKIINSFKPHLIIVFGDRYEMLAGPCAAIPFNLPVIHFYGGAVTQGATDELVRHAITKFSHMHFVALPVYKKRLLQMGEENWRIKVIGIPNIKNLKNEKTLTTQDLSKIFNLNFKEPVILATFHSVTLELLNLDLQIKNFLDAIKKTKLQCIFTYPNADRGYEKIISNINTFCKGNKKYKFVKSLSSKLFSNLLRKCSIMVGNSSSGIVEAASFKLAVVNIGSRQEGKFKPKNILDCKNNKNLIYKSIKYGLSKKFKNDLKNISNPYDRNVSLDEISRFIINQKIDDKLLRKKFINID